MKAIIIVGICFVIIATCIIANIMNVVAYSIHRHKLNDINECFHEFECKDVDIFGEMEEICYSTECDYLKKYDEYFEWKEKGITSFIWRIVD